ncbi:sensor histidine kinase [Oleisolibacter albus]|uniref:sensor histidine kinase n=1 Tax=Oleisolibacter albus TaxID=2171757 RepID=UPI000DF15DD4|nr:sensor histidine kinase [Oleisolibacter albus]
MRPTTTRQQLTRLVLIALVPLLALAGLLVWWSVQEATRTAQERTLVAARLLAASIDRELDALRLSLDTMAGMPDLAAGRLESFYAFAVTAKPDRVDAVALIDGNGRPVFNTLRPFGAPLPASKIEDVFRAAAQGERFQVSDLFLGNLAGRPIFVIMRPVRVEGQRHLLAFTLFTDQLQRLLAGLPSPYVGLVADRSGTIAARSYAPEAVVGRALVAETQALLAGRGEGQGLVTSPEGVRVRVAAVRSAEAGWIAVVGEAQSLLLTEAWRLGSSTFLLCLLLVGIVFVALRQIARRLGQSFEDLADVAAGMAQDRVPALRLPPATAEIRAVEAALQDSHHRILQHTQELERARRAAERANTAKDQFLAHVSHELRTPLTAIIGFAEVLEVDEQARPGPAGEYLGYILQAGRHLLSLINDILDLSKIGAGRWELMPEALALDGVLANAMTLVAGQAKDRSIRLESALPPDLPPARADRRAVLQIAVNLLSNAVKFSPPGAAVRVDLTAEAGLLCIRIGDTGPGMTAEEAAQALLPFRQGAHAQISDVRGTGLGLPLAKQLAELQGGSLRLDTAPGRGTMVEVRLPAA